MKKLSLQEIVNLNKYLNDIKKNKQYLEEVKNSFISEYNKVISERLVSPNESYVCYEEFLDEFEKRRYLSGKLQDEIDMVDGVLNELKIKENDTLIKLGEKTKDDLLTERVGEFLDKTLEKAERELLLIDTSLEEYETLKEIKEFEERFFSEDYSMEEKEKLKEDLNNIRDLRTNYDLLKSTKEEEILLLSNSRPDIKLVMKTKKLDNNSKK